MFKFEFDKDTDCLRCHHCLSHTCFGDKHTVHCDVKKELIGRAKVPTYCPSYDFLHGDSQQMASK